jgi:DNA-binding SARP family transcriptional activator/TolB-like protein
VVRIHCLGQLTVLRDGQALGGAATQPRRLAIVALMAAAGERGVSREKLLAFLWPDLDEARARRTLSQAVYALRRDIGTDDAIVGVRELRFDQALVQSDVAEFRDAIARRDWDTAATNYEGPFLDGYHLAGAPELEHWIEETRIELAHRYAEAAEQAALARDHAGDAAGAVPWWRRLAAHDPHNARVAIRLMRALAAAGDRTGAIRHASIHAALLEQLELPSDAEVMAFAEELRTSAPVSTTPIATSAEGVVEPPDAVEDEGDARGIHVREQPGRQAAVERPVAVPRPSTIRRSTLVIGLGLGIVATILVITMALRPGPGFDPDWVIVAPLENRTTHPSLDPVGTMAAEWVTQGLARTGLVQVVDAQTMIALAREVEKAGTDRPIRALAERAGAGTVISGSYYLESGTLRFQTQITDARSGRLVRDIDAVTAPVTQPTDALEPLRERVTGALALLRDERLGQATAAGSQPPLYPAYQEFLVGMADFGENYESAIQHFRRAAAIDSTFGQALLWAGQSYANVSDYATADSIFRLLEHNRARLPPYDQANFDYFYLGFVRGDWRGSYEGARRMVSLAPAAPHALFALGTTATIENRPAEALRALQRIDIDRGWGRDWALRVLTLRARAFHQLGDHEHELVEARRLRKREPGMGWTRIPEIRALAGLGRIDELRRAVDAGLSFPPTARTWEAYSPGELLYQAGRELEAHGHADVAIEMWQHAILWYRDNANQAGAPSAMRHGLADVLLATGQLDEARVLFDALLAEEPDNPATIASIGVIAVHQKRTADARHAIERLSTDGRPWTFGRPALGLARVHAVMGETDAAIRDIRQARREGYARIYFLHLEPEFASLASSSAWQSLLAPLSGDG